MSECNSIETSNLDNQQFRLNKINEIKDYFIAEIKERELMSKRLGVISIASFATVIGIPVGIACASIRLPFSLSTGLVKKLLKITRKKKKKHNKIVMLARSKLNSIESKIYKALMNNQISHEDFMTIVVEEKNYRELKESIRMMKEDKKIDID